MRRDRRGEARRQGAAQAGGRPDQGDGLGRRDVPADELSATQYALEELRVAVEVADAARTYVMAHAYNDESVKNCLKSGVRSIEHGNLIDEETARLIAQAGAYLVPTLVTYEAISEEGKSYNVPENLKLIMKGGRAFKNELDK